MLTRIPLLLVGVTLALFIASSANASSVGFMTLEGYPTGSASPPGQPGSFDLLAVSLTSANSLVVLREPDSDSTQFQEFVANGTFFNSMQIDIFDINGSETNLLQSLLFTNVWANSYSFFGTTTGLSSEEIGFQFATVTVSTVPLPAAVWLFVSALGVFGYLGKRKANA